jgi:hypothetical protein
MKPGRDFSMDSRNHDHTHMRGREEGQFNNRIGGRVAQGSWGHRSLAAAEVAPPIGDLLKSPVAAGDRCGSTGRARSSRGTHRRGRGGADPGVGGA